MKAKDHTFYGFTGLITHLRCWGNTRKACESLAFGSQSWFTSIPSALPTSQVGYHAGKPIESVVYCLDKLTDKQAQLDCPVDFSWRYK